MVMGIVQVTPILTLIIILASSPSECQGQIAPNNAVYIFLIHTNCAVCRLARGEDVDAVRAQDKHGAAKGASEQIFTHEGTWETQSRENERASVNVICHRR